MSIRIALAGNPNCGKTTLFNLLTGSDCHVGNWPGVTVEKRSGIIKSLHGAELVDLPGIYSLRTLSDEEGAALGFLINEKPDLIINVINANDLERSLYLTVQLELLGVPTVAALNMTDVLKKRGDKLDYNLLGALLGIRAVPVSAAENTGIDELLAACENAFQEKISSPRYDFLPDGAKLIAELISPVCKDKSIPTGIETLRLMRGDISACDLLSQREAQVIENLISSNETENSDRELLTVSHIYRFTDSVCKKALRKSKRSGENFSRRADKILLNRFAAVPLFLAAVLTVFYLTFGSLGTRLGELADSFINGTLADVLMRLLGSLGASEWVKDLVCGGILAGLGSVCSFLPQIALLFFFLGLLEDCGYMARGAFIAAARSRRQVVRPAVHGLRLLRARADEHAHSACGARKENLRGGYTVHVVQRENARLCHAHLGVLPECALGRRDFDLFARHNLRLRRFADTQKMGLQGRRTAVCL